jgi:ribose 5-phosphate isomerase A
MKDRTKQTNIEEKKAAALSAVNLVEDGMIIGLGTGSTVAYTIEEIGNRLNSGDLCDVQGIPTSYQSELLAIDAGIPLTSLAESYEVHLAIDGVDQINRDFIAIKGGGGAHTREKIVSISSSRFIIIADESKVVETLNHPIPIEVLPFAKDVVMDIISQMSGDFTLRMGIKKDGPIITDNGNFIIDADFGTMDNIMGISMILSTIPGVVEHGIFNIIHELHIGKKNGKVEILTNDFQLDESMLDMDFE